MIRVQTPSRLHFGMLSLATEGARWPGRHGDTGLPVRRFGSAGLTIEKPGVSVSAAPAAEWTATGPLADRALEFARRFTQSCDVAPSPHRIVVERCPPEHVGLGVGTQLGLAVAKALAVSSGLMLDAVELGRRVQRGVRSGLGVHGFAEGGFLVDAGRRSNGGIAPLVARVPFPEAWRVLLVIPPSETGLHGRCEQAAFAMLSASTTASSQTEALCRLVLLGLLPALLEQDLSTFSEALFEFNARAGEAFAPSQGGTYGSPIVAGLIDFFRKERIAGVGQSSWGPAVFAVSDQEDRLRFVAQEACRRFAWPAAIALVTKGCNRGAFLG